MGLITFDYKRLDKIWGNENWMISAHKSGMSYINSGQYKGMSLEEFFNKHKDLLGIEKLDQFPLLVKIINAKDDLSVQVHPNDEYAKKDENTLGKSECWYNISDNKSDIVIGQNTKNRDELALSIKENKIMDKLNILDTVKGDFFYIPAGCVHAIRKNTQILEIQQSSDITYRLYDYKRKDDNGNLRELHILKSLDVIDYEFENKNKIQKIENNDFYEEISLTNNEFFIVKKIIIKKEYELKSSDKYMLGINLEGNIKVLEKTLEKYESFMILSNDTIVLKGQGEIILTTSK